MNNEKLPTTIEAFQIYLTKIRNYSELTAISYAQDLRHFVRWYRSIRTDARWSNVTRDVIDQYIITMKTERARPATINRHLSAIAGIYKFFKRQGLPISEIPVKYESRQKLAKTEPNTIPIEDVEAAIAHADNETALALKILVTTGIRASELLNIRREDVNLQERSIRINGKGSKQRTIFITAETANMIKNQEASSTLFTYANTRALRRKIYEALAPYSDAQQLSPHALRHTFATQMASKGMQTLTLANLLGHNDTNTTKRYTHMNLASQRAQYDALTN